MSLGSDVWMCLHCWCGYDVLLCSLKKGEMCLWVLLTTILKEEVSHVLHYNSWRHHALWSKTFNL